MAARVCSQCSASGERSDLAIPIHSNTDFNRSAKQDGNRMVTASNIYFTPQRWVYRAPLHPHHLRAKQTR